MQTADPYLLVVSSVALAVGLGADPFHLEMRPAALNSKLPMSDASKWTYAFDSTDWNVTSSPFSCSCTVSVPPSRTSRFTYSPPVRTTSKSPPPTLRTVPMPKRLETTSMLPESTLSFTRPDASILWSTAVVAPPAGLIVTVSARLNRHQPKNSGELRNE